MSLQIRRLLPLFLALAGAGWPAEDLARPFAHPPPSARPWVLWFPLDGNLSREGITADLEAMQRVGIGGVLAMETVQGTPAGPVAFAGPAWRGMIAHVCAEAHRLGLEVNLNNDAGWCGSGGPWITPELSMQRMVWTETNLTGPQSFRGTLPQPRAVRDFYRDIAVYAYPTPAHDSRIPRLAGKSAAQVEEVALRAEFPVLPPEAVVARDQIISLTARLARDGRIEWEVPAGNWTLLRLGCTTTGAENHPAPLGGRGLECDKLSQRAVEVHFDALLGRLIADNAPLVGETKTLVAIHTDSWEVGAQNWTPAFREEFQRLRGYDPLPLLPVVSGRIVDSVEVSERFLWDLRQTVSQLIAENYAGHLRTLARRHGMRFTMEAYGKKPFEDLSVAGRADEPTAEFWAYSAAEFGREHYSCAEMASAAHVYGHPIVGAEAFTSDMDEKWLAHPATLKPLGDWAFGAGINRFVFHRYAHQPWTNPDRPPGMGMGPWGVHYERTQTWWEQSRPWHEYLARCQFLLRQGLFVADLCYLTPECSMKDLVPPAKARLGRPGHNFDFCPPDALLTRMSVRDGQLVLPDGMTYRMLVLPQVEVMTPRLLRKIRDLVVAGATVLGAPPRKSPSLENFPRCDEEVQSLAREIWGERLAPTDLAGRAVGQGRVIWPADLRAPPEPPYDEPSALPRAKWIWFREAAAGVNAPVGPRYFSRAFDVESGQSIESARLVMTADNSFHCFLNGEPVSSGNRRQTGYRVEVASNLRPGSNRLTVAAVNTGDAPNPAGLIGALLITYANGQRQEIVTDASWRASQTEHTDGSAARELGSAGQPPFGAIQEVPPATTPAIDIAFPNRVFARMGLPPDFRAPTNLRYIHRRLGNIDVYFVANPEPRELDTVCTFRVSGRHPEIWRPESGHIERAVTFEMKDGCTRVPLRFDPSGSMFVVFREEVSASRPPSPGKNWLEFGPPQEIGGSWEVSFDPQWGGPPSPVRFEQLDDWAQRAEPGVRHYSGTAVYRKTFRHTGAGSRPPRMFLDLGRVDIIAEVRLNGHDLGIAWKSPYRLEATDALQSGVNTLEIKVVNLWVNRMIGDEQLPDDSERNANGTLKSWPSWLETGRPSPTGRFTFASWRLWRKDSPLVPSGLRGPVALLQVQ